MPIKDNFILKEIAGEYVIIPISNKNLDTTKLFNVNETGAFIFKKLKENKTVEEIKDLMKKEYDAEDEELINDINYFIDLLKKKGIYNEN